MTTTHRGHRNRSRWEGGAGDSSFGVSEINSQISPIEKGYIQPHFDVILKHFSWALERSINAPVFDLVI